MTFPTQQIENKIGYTFQNKDLLRQAFTHSTYANAHGGKDNERMEYLGDTVLQLVVTEWQVLVSQENEGVLTKERQKLVCEETLYREAKQLGLDKCLLVSGSKDNVGKKTVSSLYETVVAAIYLDGGYSPAKAFIYQTLLQQQAEKERNPKGELQEFLQSQGAELPVYQSVKEGKDNDPTFRCTVTALGKSANGEGSSKRRAEQQAAELLLRALQR